MIMLPRHGTVCRLFRILPLLAVAFSLFSGPAQAQQPPKKFKVLAIAEKGGLHQGFVDAAKLWLAQESIKGNFTVDYIEDTVKIDDALLAQYQLFIQLNFPPYAWTPTATAAFQKYINEGRGGWIGFHHATLLGEFDGYPIWPWFSDFMGGIRFKTYIPTFATGTVAVEALQHPVMKGISGHFTIENEEWYTYDKSPRPNVHVLASVDENSYSPAGPIKMGDHPVVWTNEHIKARNVYIFMGHHAELFQNSSFTTLFHNSILWAAQQ
jgi:type 1 glutamine amidotransferase